MSTIRMASAMGLIMLLTLVVSCADPPTSPPPEPAVRQGINSVPAAAPTVALANPQSVTPAKQVDPASTKGPRLTINAEAVDFGEIPYSQAIALSFTIKNVGAAPVSLGPAFIRVKEGC
ncbi:MAG: hypothetical protein HYX94_01125 [Chloroflexi bacterium]|nr:hypothetical protein [Chloroflexota bacterium]